MVMFMVTIETNTSGYRVACISQLVIIFSLLALSVAHDGEALFHGWCVLGVWRAPFSSCVLLGTPGLPPCWHLLLASPLVWPLGQMSLQAGLFRKHTGLPTASCRLCCPRQAEPAPQAGDPHPWPVLLSSECPPEAGLRFQLLPPDQSGSKESG